MTRYFARPHGSIADISNGRGKPVTAHCLDCGAGIRRPAKRCGPCAYERRAVALKAYTARKRQERRGL
jgi:hypothetical protein